MGVNVHVCVCVRGKRRRRRRDSACCFLINSKVLCRVINKYYACFFCFYHCVYFHCVLDCHSLRTCMCECVSEFVCVCGWSVLVCAHALTNCRLTSPTYNLFPSHFVHSFSTLCSLLPAIEAGERTVNYNRSQSKCC